MICSSVLINISDKVEHEIPGLQLLFIIVLVSFTLNYYLIREGHINPYLETEEAHSKAKVIGFLAIISIGSFFYAYQTSAKSFVLFLLFTSWLVSAIVERCIYKESYSRYDTLASLIVLAGAVIVNIPLIQIGEGEFIFTQDFVVGIIMGLICCVSTGCLGVNFSRLGNFNILSINHVVLLIVLLFIPLFFPIQGLIPPNFLTWVVTILLGVMFFFIAIFFIRSLQLEKSTIILLYLNLLVAANIVIETIFVSGILNTLWSYLGAALIVVGLVLVGKEAFTRVETQKVRDSFTLKDVVGEQKRDIEMSQKK
jgi:drug/metabolite transporter (DMT)-like permease